MPLLNTRLKDFTAFVAACHATGLPLLVIPFDEGATERVMTRMWLARGRVFDAAEVWRWSLIVDRALGEIFLDWDACSTPRPR